MYRIRGGDGGEYGPVSAQQLQQWIADGRANRQSLVLGSGQTEWKALETFPEFAGALSISSLPPQLLRTEPVAGIPTYLWPSLVATLCCCPPFGIVATIYAGKVGGKLAAGDRPAALDASKKARIWFWITVGLGTLAYLIELILAMKSGVLKIYR